MSIPGKVALLGANGSVGRALGPLLGQRSIPYRVVGRSLLALQIRFNDQPFCEPMQWDPSEKGAFSLACDGTAAVVFLIGAPVWKYDELITLTEQALTAARVAGVRRFLLMTPNWSYGPALDRPFTEDDPRRPETEKSKIRRDQEDMVLAAHLPGEFATAVLRVADLYGPRVEASALWTVFQAAKRGTVAQVPGPIDVPHEFVFVLDVAETLAQILADDALWSSDQPQTWNLAGAGVTTISAMAEKIFASEGQPSRYNVPGRLMMWSVRLVNPYIREMREMAYLQRQAVLLNDDKLTAALGALQKTPYEEGIRQTLALK